MVKGDGKEIFTAYGGQQSGYCTLLCNNMLPGKKRAKYNTTQPHFFSGGFALFNGTKIRCLPSSVLYCPNFCLLLRLPGV
jgi:hypothetical protein